MLKFGFQIYDDKEKSKMKKLVCLKLKKEKMML